MRRVPSTPRENWQKKVEEAGLIWHSGAQPYWDESAFYEFTAKEVDVLEAATNELETMTLAAAQHIIDNKLYARMGIPENAVPLIESSWEAEPPSLYGRFDFAFDGAKPPKLLEFNADTPTSLLEAAVVQWYWLQDAHPKRDQFNSIHERLIALWKELASYLPDRSIRFCSMDDIEDGMTVTYLEDTARQAGLTASSFPIRRNRMGRQHLRRTRRPSPGRSLQTLPLGMDGSRSLCVPPACRSHALDGAGLEDAPLQQGLAAGAYGRSIPVILTCSKPASTRPV